MRTENGPDTNRFHSKSQGTFGARGEGCGHPIGTNQADVLGAQASCLQAPKARQPGSLKVAFSERVCSRFALIAGRLPALQRPDKLYSRAFPRRLRDTALRAKSLGHMSLMAAEYRLHR